MYVNVGVRSVCLIACNSKCITKTQYVALKINKKIMKYIKVLVVKDIFKTTICICDRTTCCPMLSNFSYTYYLLFLVAQDTHLLRLLLTGLP